MYAIVVSTGCINNRCFTFQSAYIPLGVRLLIEVVASVASGVAGIVPHASLFMFVTVTSIR